MAGFNRNAAIKKIADVELMETKLAEELAADTLILGLAEELYKCTTATEVAQLRGNNVYSRYCALAIQQNKSLVGTRYNKWGKLNNEIESLAIAGGWKKPDNDVEDV